MKSLTKWNIDFPGELGGLRENSERLERREGEYTFFLKNVKRAHLKRCALFAEGSYLEYKP